MIAEGFARLARDDCLESPTLSVVRSLVDHDLALTVSLRDLAGEFAKQRPIQACTKITLWVLPKSRLLEKLKRARK